MAKYLMEAKPPITREDLFQDGWEIDTFHADSDERAIARIDKLMAKHDIGRPITIRLSCEGRAIRTFKGKGESGPR